MCVPMASVGSELRKADSSRRTRRRVLVAAAVCVSVVGCVLAVVLVVAVDRLGSDVSQREFDRSDWVAAEFGSRCPMMDDSVRQVEPGITRGEVTDRLGEPDYAGRDYVEYFLGACNGLTIDVHLLRVEFSAELVERAFIASG